MTGHSPNFFLVGAMKCGTTTLYRYLDNHPAVYLSPVKEPNHYSDDLPDGLFWPNDYTDVNTHNRSQNRSGKDMHVDRIVRPEDYQALFDAVQQETVVGEASTSYLYSREAAKNIAAIAPDAKIMILLRDPVARAYSHYRMDLAIGRTRLSFSQTLPDELAAAKEGIPGPFQYLDLGLYHDQIQRYMDQFPAANIQVIKFDDLRANSHEVLRSMAEFLGVDVAGFSTITHHANQGVTPRFAGLNHWLEQVGIKGWIRHRIPRSWIEAGKQGFYSNGRPPAIDTADAALLREFFASDIAQVEKLLSWDLSTWKSQP